MNLFCIPCAGGSAVMFKKIQNLLLQEVKVRLLELAGLTRSTTVSWALVWVKYA